MSVRSGWGEDLIRRRAELEEYLRNRPQRLAEHLKGEDAKRRGGTAAQAAWARALYDEAGM